MVPRVLIASTIVLAGGAIGLGLTTFRYAKGLSYLSADPRACANCHIMQAQYDSWQKSSHHAAATCSGCHLPVQFPANYLAKALNGWHHSKAFTLQDFHEPIQIGRQNARILQSNCMRCHGDVLHGTNLGPRDHSADLAPLSCTHCHEGVGHGSRAGLGKWTDVPADFPSAPSLPPLRTEP